MNEEEKLALIEHCKDVISCHVSHGGDSDEEAVYRIALAALTAEPVSWRHNNGPFGKIATCSENLAKRWEREGFDISPLYTAPPVPQMQDIIEAVNELLNNDGSRGTYSAIRCHDARERIEKLLVNYKEVT